MKSNTLLLPGLKVKPLNELLSQPTLPATVFFLMRALP